MGNVGMKQVVNGQGKLVNINFSLYICIYTNGFIFLYSSCLTQSQSVIKCMANWYQWVNPNLCI